MDTELNILIVEDEIFASKYLLEILKSLGFCNIYEVTNSDDALSIVKNKRVDLVFMDINIEGAIDGIECSNILNNEYFIPVIFTTAYGDSQTIKEASTTNLYGYLVKPFEAHDVEAVLRVTLKMIRINIEENLIIKNKCIIDFGENQLFDVSKETLFINNTPINLTKKELDVLKVFCLNINQNISYEVLKQKVWNNEDISNSTIRDTISRLKKKVSTLNIENIINFGYILKIV